MPDVLWQPALKDMFERFQYLLGEAHDLDRVTDLENTITQMLAIATAKDIALNVALQQRAIRTRTLILYRPVEANP